MSVLRLPSKASVDVHPTHSSQSGPNGDSNCESLTVRINMYNSREWGKTLSHSRTYLSQHIPYDQVRKANNGGTDSHGTDA